MIIINVLLIIITEGFGHITCIRIRHKAICYEKERKKEIWSKDFLLDGSFSKKLNSKIYQAY